jgi:hypothetical protein
MTSERRKSVTLTSPNLATVESGPGGYRVGFPHIRDRYRETRKVIAALKAIDGRRYDPVAQAWYIPAASSAELEVWAVEVGAERIDSAATSEDPAELARLRAQVDGLHADVQRLTEALRLEKDAAGRRSVAGRTVRPHRKPATPRQVSRSGKPRKVRGHYRYRASTDGAYATWCETVYGASSAPSPFGVTSARREPADPTRCARLFPLWRKAHHRYARRWAALGPGDALTKAANRTAFAMLAAIQRATDKHQGEPAAAPMS